MNDIDTGELSHIKPYSLLEDLLCGIQTAWNFFVILLSSSYETLSHELSLLNKQERAGCSETATEYFRFQAELEFGFWTQEMS